MYRSLFAITLVVVVCLSVFIWASDRITMEGERTVYTVTCEQGAWDGLHCNGKMVAGDRHRFRASRSRREIVYWIAGSSQPSGKFSDCEVVDRDRWVCKAHDGDLPTIAHELSEGKPVQHAGGPDMPFHAVNKWKWWVIDAGIPGFRKADFSNNLDPRRDASLRAVHTPTSTAVPASVPASVPPSVPTPSSNTNPPPVPNPAAAATPAGK